MNPLLLHQAKRLPTSWECILVVCFRVLEATIGKDLTDGSPIEMFTLHHSHRQVYVCVSVRVLVCDFKTNQNCGRYQELACRKGKDCRWQTWRPQVTSLIMSPLVILILWIFRQDQFAPPSLNPPTATLRWCIRCLTMGPRALWSTIKAGPFLKVSPLLSLFRHSISPIWACWSPGGSGGGVAGVPH